MMIHKLKDYTQKQMHNNSLLIRQTPAKAELRNVRIWPSEGGSEHAPSYVRFEKRLLIHYRGNHTTTHTALRYAI